MPVERPHQDGWSELGGSFDAAMGRFGPFESAPHLAVAVSGGPDSMALAVLSRDWAWRRGGRVTALIVDHGLRSGSSAEASLVRDRLDAIGVGSEVLEWRGAKPQSGIQAAARSARYDLLSDWCRRRGVLHLLTGHHAADQAETIAMRAARHSGLDGLAGMSAVVEWRDCRLLRPLLRVARRDLLVALSGAGIPWVEDPSNADPRFERARLRAGSETATVLPNQADRAGAVRQQRERLLQSSLGQSLQVHPLGFCTVDLTHLDGEAAASCLIHAVAWVGGSRYRPSRRAAHRLCAQVLELSPGRVATLGGCTVRRRKGSVAIVRESARLPAPAHLGPASGQLWDGRFWVEGSGASDLRMPIHIGALGAVGWNLVRADVSSHRIEGVPRSALASLPTLWRDGKPVAIPSLCYQTIPYPWFSAVFRPHRTLLPVPFAVA
jgi:tRNA(Ile)-lysidine synthase